MEVKEGREGWGNVVASNFQAFYFIDVGYRFLFQVIKHAYMHANILLSIYMNIHTCKCGCLITYTDEGPSIFLCQVFHITYILHGAYCCNYQPFYGGEGRWGWGNNWPTIHNTFSMMCFIDVGYRFLFPVTNMYVMH